MHMIDFEYNGERLSDYGLYPCYLDGSANDTVEVANLVSINKVKAPNSQKYISTGYAYEDVLNAQFQALKIGCNVNNSSITDVELNRIMRWLNRKRYCVFKPIYENGRFSNVYFEAFFNVRPIVIGEEIVGIDLTLNTNAPYGFIEPNTYRYEFSPTSNNLVIYDESDEIGHSYCDAIITCLENGDLKITNTLDPNNEVVIRDCSVGEVITLKGKEKIILSSLPGHTSLANDFNYNYFRMNNTYENNRNVFKSSLRCNIEVTYSPIRKVGLIV